MDLPNFTSCYTPLRPILAAYNTVSHKLSKFLVPLLEPLTTNDYTVKIVTNFSDAFLMRSSFPALPWYASALPLFTNIPVNETINIILNKLYNYSELFHRMSRSIMNSFLQIAISDSFFDRRAYIQVDLVSLGSPLGPTLVNIFLCHHEEIWLNNCPIAFKSIVYKRYIDDTFLIFKAHSHINNFLQYLNSKHENIKFTAEVEADNSLFFPFLI